MFINNIPVFRAMLQNYNSRLMNRNMIGYTLKKDYGPFGFNEIHQYADATCDDFTKYSGEKSPAPPFFFSKELYPLFKKILTHRDLKLNLLRMVHGQQSLRSYDAISHNEIFSVEMTVADITETEAGELLVIKTKGSSNGKLILEAESGFIVRGVKKETERVSKKEKFSLRNISGSDEISFSVKTVKGQEKKYARVSNDTNPIHTSNYFAKAAGLPGRILHGICVMAMCTNTLIDGLADSEISRFSEVSGRFSYPVFAGDVLKIIGYRFEKDGFHGVNFNVYEENGKAVINKGFFLYK